MPTADDHAHLLDTLEVGLAEYDEALRAVRWNRTFLRFFPEHAGAIHVGEAYAENLRRFYGVRLKGSDTAQIERLIAEGIARHRGQLAPFDFTHHERVLRASSLPCADGSRLRIWKELPRPAEPATGGLPAFDALEHLSDGACVVDASSAILVTNSRFRALYDIPASEPVVGRSLDEVVAGLWGEAAAIASIRAAIRNGLRYDDAPFLVELPGDRWRRVVTRHADSRHSYLVHADVTASHRTQRDLAELARRDSLTGLLNRRGFDDHFAGRSQDAALLLIDVDLFKQINDRHGHARGDDCLRHIAEICARRALAAGGSAARIGGEEFAMLIEGTSWEAAIALAGDLRAEVAAGTSDLPALTVSIGLGHGAPDGLYATADNALYRAKARGRNRVETGRSRRACA